MRKMLFLLSCLLSQVHVLLAEFQANYAEALQKTIYFFDAQRSGKLEGNRVIWRSDSALNDAAVQAWDGTIVDLSGGYYDAGDNIKYGLPFAFSTTMLGWSIYEFSNSYETSGQLPYALNNLKWATDYILKAWHPEQQRLYAQVGTTDIDHDYYYVPYEVLDIAHQQKAQPRKAYYIDPQFPGSDLAGSTAAALAVSYLVFQRYGNTDYAQKLLIAAQEIYQFGKTYPGFYTKAISSQGDPHIYDTYDPFSGDTSEKTLYQHFYLGLAAAWLAKISNNPAYLQDAIQFAPVSYYLNGDTSNWSNNTTGTFILLSQLIPDATLAANYQARVQNWIQQWLKMRKTPQGLAFYSTWGGNLSYVSNAGFMALVFSKSIKNKNPSLANQIETFVKNQANYILGNNSNSMSYLVGYGPKWPKHLQHAEAQGGWSGIEDLTKSSLKAIPDRHILFGALVGGPDQNDFYHDDREDYETTETAIDYVAGAQGMMAGLNELYPGAPLINFPTAYEPQAPTALNQYYITSQYTNVASNKVSLKLDVYNHSFWPARVTSSPSLRFYLTLNNNSPSTMIVKYGTKQLPLQLYNSSKGIYYFTVDLNQAMYPGGIYTVNQFPIPSQRTITITIQSTIAHDFTKDWSLLNVSSTKRVNSNITFYDTISPSNPIKLSGDEPPLL